MRVIIKWKGEGGRAKKRAKKKRYRGTEKEKREKQRETQRERNTVASRTTGGQTEREINIEKDGQT